MFTFIKALLVRCPLFLQVNINTEGSVFTGVPSEYFWHRRCTSGSQWTWSSTWVAGIRGRHFPSPISLLFFFMKHCGTTIRHCGSNEKPRALGRKETERRQRREEKRKNRTCSKWKFNFDISITCWPCQGQNKHGETWLRHWICTVVLNSGLKEEILPVFSNPEHSVVKYMYNWQCSLQIKYSELWNQTDPVFWP